MVFKWQQGLLSFGDTMYRIHRDLSLCICLHCQFLRAPSYHHAGDPLSILTHCVGMSTHRQTLHDLWPSSLRPDIQAWFTSASLTDRRLYIRQLIPVSLYSRLQASPQFEGLGTSDVSREISAAVKTRTKGFLEILYVLLSHMMAYVPVLLHTSLPGPDMWAATPEPPVVPVVVAYKRPRSPTGLRIEQKRKKKKKKHSQ
jgi:hypothetical protein